MLNAVDIRTEQILADRDYRLALIEELAAKHPEKIDAFVECNAGNWVSELAAVRAELRSLARDMAISEATANLYLTAIVPNNVHSLRIRSQA